MRGACGRRSSPATSWRRTPRARASSAASSRASSREASRCGQGEGGGESHLALPPQDQGGEGVREAEAEVEGRAINEVVPCMNDARSTNYNLRVAGYG